MYDFAKSHHAAEVTMQHGNNVRSFYGRDAVF